jgi:hypothetical protein
MKLKDLSIGKVVLSTRENIIGHVKYFTSLESQPNIDFRNDILVGVDWCDGSTTDESPRDLTEPMF